MARISTDKLTPEQREEIDNDDAVDLEKLMPASNAEIVKAFIEKAKGNPFVLALLSIAGGLGGQEGLQILGQQIPWYCIALAVVGLGVLQYFADSKKRQTRLIEEIINIKDQLKVGAKMMSDTALAAQIAADLARDGHRRIDELEKLNGRPPANGTCAES